MPVTVWNAAHAAHLRVSTTALDGLPVLAAEGELDSWTAESPAWTMAVVDACAGEGPRVLVLDLRRLYFMDFVGLTALEQFAAEFARLGRRLLLAGVRPRIREFLRNTSVGISADCLSLEDALDAAAGGALAPGAPLATAA